MAGFRKDEHDKDPKSDDHKLPKAEQDRREQDRKDDPPKHKPDAEREQQLEDPDHVRRHPEQAPDAELHAREGTAQIPPAAVAPDEQKAEQERVKRETAEKPTPVKPLKADDRDEMVAYAKQVIAQQSEREVSDAAGRSWLFRVDRSPLTHLLIRVTRLFHPSTNQPTRVVERTVSGVFFGSDSLDEPLEAAVKDADEATADDAHHGAHKAKD